eukprot:13263381-Alexandrium_andersonii.AAC.1
MAACTYRLPLLCRRQAQDDELADVPEDEHGRIGAVDQASQDEADFEADAALERRAAMGATQ